MYMTIIKTPHCMYKSYQMIVKTVATKAIIMYCSVHIEI